MSVPDGGWGTPWTGGLIARNTNRAAGAGLRQKPNAWCRHCEQAVWVLEGFGAYGWAACGRWRVCAEVACRRCSPHTWVQRLKAGRQETESAGASGDEAADETTELRFSGGGVWRAAAASYAHRVKAASWAWVAEQAELGVSQALVQRLGYYGVATWRRSVTEVCDAQAAMCQARQSWTMWTGADSGALCMAPSRMSNRLSAIRQGRPLYCYPQSLHALGLSPFSSCTKLTRLVRKPHPRSVHWL